MHMTVRNTDTELVKIIRFMLNAGHQLVHSPFPCKTITITKKKKMFVSREWTPNWRLTDLGPARCSEGSRDPSLGICSCMCITSYHTSTLRPCVSVHRFLSTRRSAQRGLCRRAVSVCLSVCLSVRHTPVLCLNG